MLVLSLAVLPAGAAAPKALKSGKEGRSSSAGSSGLVALEEEVFSDL